MMRFFLLALIGLIVVAPVWARRDDTADYRVTKIRFYPRAGHAAEMVGGEFVGSLTSATNDFEAITKIQTAPTEGQWAELTIPANQVRAFRFVKYQGKNGVGANIAEIEFYAGARKLTGTAFGTTGSGDPENDPKRAFDGDITTGFRGVNTYNPYVGLDLGAASQVAAPVLSAAQGSYPQTQTVSLYAPGGAAILYSRDGWGRPGRDAAGKLVGDTKQHDGKPLVIAKSTIVQAVATKPELADSITTIAAYRIGATADSKERAEFHIGNSLTDTVNPWMEPLAASGGHKIRYYRFTIPGAPTDWLWDHPGSGFGETNYAPAFLARAPLTDLVTQPFAGHNRSIDNEAEYSGRFFDLARKYSPDVQMWLYVQWTGTDFAKDNWANGVSEMTGKKVTFAEPAKTWQEAIQNHVRYTERVMNTMNEARAAEIKAGKCKPVRIIPAGMALARLKTLIDAGKVEGMKDFVAEVFHGPTDIHMTPKGAYLIALVHYACLYRDNPTGKVTAAGSGLTPAQAKLFQQIAWETATSYPYSGVR